MSLILLFRRLSNFFLSLNTFELHLFRFYKQILLKISPPAFLKPIQIKDSLDNHTGRIYPDSKVRQLNKN